MTVNANSFVLSIFPLNYSIYKMKAWVVIVRQLHRSEHKQSESCAALRQNRTTS